MADILFNVAETIECKADYGGNAVRTRSYQKSPAKRLFRSALVDRRTVLIGAVSPLLLSCTRKAPDTFVDYTVSIRVTVSVRGEERIGQSNIRATWKDNGTFMNYGARVAPDRLYGQAVPILLDSNGDYLFALLHAPEGSEYQGTYYFDASKTPAVVFSGRDADDPTEDELKAVMTRGDEVEVPAKRWPLFVRFTDRNDPSTVTQVVPASLSQTYGAGSFVKSVTVKVVREPPSENIAQILPWAGQYRRWLVEPKPGGIPSFEQPLASRLGSGHFLAWHSLNELARVAADKTERIK